MNIGTCNGPTWDTTLIIKTLDKSGVKSLLNVAPSIEKANHDVFDNEHRRNMWSMPTSFR